MTGVFHPRLEDPVTFCHAHRDMRCSPGSTGFNLRSAVSIQRGLPQIITFLPQPPSKSWE